MKTNVVLKSKDRDLFGIVIQQETKTGFLSVSELQKAYEVARAEHGWGEQSIPSLMKGKLFKLQLYNLLFKYGLTDKNLLDFNKEINQIGTCKYLKSNNLWKTTGVGKTKKVMCNPIIFKMLVIGMFGAYYYNIETDWLKEIDSSIPIRINRDESFEIDFINNSVIPKIAFIADEVKKQYTLNSLIYDLYINVLGKKILVEYQEEHHAHPKTVIKDNKKRLNAIKNGFIFLEIWITKEEEGLRQLKKIIITK